jgi:STE24 endopeptidase
MNWNIYTLLFLIFFLMHNLLEGLLGILQLKYLNNRKDKVPGHLKGKVDIETIRKSVNYSRDKLKFNLFMRVIETVPLWFMILFGFAWLDDYVHSFNMGPVLSGLLFFAAMGFAGALAGLPSELYYVFVIEQKHGFNKQSPGSFFVDKLKGALIGIIIGGLLGSLVLWIMSTAKIYWWIFAFVAVETVQLLMMWIYPLVIMPVFNKFKPVEGMLAQRVEELARNVGFPLKGVVSMDGSRRSAHSNAFIIGFKGARRIVLYDTLIEKLAIPKLVAVLGHELGHFKLGHIKKRMVVMFVVSFFVFAALGWAENQDALYNGLGFTRKSVHGALIVFGLIFSEMTFPFGYISRLFSRRDEFAADRFAVDAVKNGEDLSEALIALSKQNLTSPGSHKWYRHYYNSHPALKERLLAIKNYASKQGYSC